ncbi:hypothetical protein EON00_12460 [Burkholderia sp. ISTR5]|jgi:hypothetical protein|nr:hypothetical protein [Burkholderia sp. ISTR5]
MIAIRAREFIATSSRLRYRSRRHRVERLGIGAMSVRHSIPEGESRLKKILIGLALAAASMSASLTASAADLCQGGSLLTGTVLTAPVFVSGSQRQGIYLSHTHVNLRGTDGRTYDVAMDNVFANGYRRNQKSVPDPLTQIRVGDQLELCGQLYTGGDVGIHWVHTNCGDTPTPDEPNGWVKDLSQPALGNNLESNETYCYLW